MNYRAEIEAAFPIGSRVEVPNFFPGTVVGYEPSGLLIVVCPGPWRFAISHRQTRLTEEKYPWELGYTPANPATPSRT